MCPKVTQVHKWNWNSAVSLPKQMLLPLQTRPQNTEPLPPCSSANPLGDINNQLRNPVPEPQRLRFLLNPALEAAVTNRSGHVPWDPGVISLAFSPALRITQTTGKALAESRTKWKVAKARISPTTSNVHHVATFLFKINGVSLKFAHRG